MKNRSGELRLIAVSVIVVALTLYTAAQYLLRSSDKSNENILPLTLETTAVPTSPEVEKTVSTAKKGNESAKKTKQPTSAAVQTAANSKIKGTVVSKFYSPYTANTSYNGIYLKNSTGLKIDLKELVSAELPYQIEKNEKPQVLILHTHTTESFLPETRDYYTAYDQSRTQDESANVVALGNIVAEKLNAAGIKTVHDTTVHDYPAYNGSYERAAETIRKNLEKYPSIKIVIDLHRDAIAGDGTDRIKPIAEINGKNAAQVMLVMGSQSGGITNFPDWKENLKLAVRFQQRMESMYPGLARSISFMSRLYNENLTTGSMLLEVGTEVNSMEEVTYSAELVANALVATLNGAQ